MSRRKMEEELTCPICMELFCHPRRLPCGHSYCQACIRAMLNSKAEESGMYYNYFRPLICPECREEVSVDFVQGVEGLPLDFKLSKLVEVVRFMKTKDSSSSDSEGSHSRDTRVRGGPGSAQGKQSVGSATPTGNRGIWSPEQASHSLSNGAQLCARAPDTDTSNASEPQVHLSSLAVGTDSSNSVSTQGAPSSIISQTETTERSAALGFESRPSGVDHTVRFDSLLSSRQNTPSLSPVTPQAAENQIHFSLSSLPGNAWANSAPQNHASLPSHQDQSRSAIETESSTQRGLFRGISSDSTRASSLPQTSSTQSGNVGDLGEGTRTQPETSASCTYLPGGAAASHSETATKRVSLRGQSGTNGVKPTDREPAPGNTSKSKSSKARWRNLFGSSSSSSSSWSRSDLDDSLDSQDSDLDIPNQAQKKGGQQTSRAKSASIPAATSVATTTATGSSSTCSTAVASPSASSRAPSTNNKNKKSKKWLMTRFLRSVVFSDSSSTYGSEDSSDSVSDDDKGARSNQNKNEARDSVRLSAVNKTGVSNKGLTSNSLPNIADASDQRVTGQPTIQTSQTFDNFRSSPANHNHAQLNSQSVSGIGQSSALEGGNSGNHKNFVRGACVKKSPVSSQTEVKEPSSLSGQPAGENCNFPQERHGTRPSVSSQTEVKELSNTDKGDETNAAVENSQGIISRTRLASNTEPKEQAHLTSHFHSEPCSNSNLQNNTCLPSGNLSPRTIYDNVSPDQASSQPFCFRNRPKNSNNSNIVSPPSAGELHSRYDNFDPGFGQRVYSEGNYQAHEPNMSGPHEISNLKECTATSSSNPMLEVNCDQTSLSNPVESAQGQGNICVADQSPTLYDNIESQDPEVGLNASLQVGQNQGTEIEDLKTGLEQSRQYIMHPERLQAIAEMENVRTESLLSSVTEPSLLASSAAEQDISQSGERMDCLHLQQLSLSTEPCAQYVTSPVECNSSLPEASRYDNVNSGFNEHCASGNFEVDGDSEACTVQVGQDGRVVYSPARLPVTTVGSNTSSDVSLTGMAALHGVSTEETVHRIPKHGENPIRDLNSPQIELVGGRSSNPVAASTRSDGTTNVAMTIETEAEGKDQSSIVPPPAVETEQQWQENNNNYKTSRNAAPANSGTGNDERNDDADVEDDDDDDEENAHSSSAMLKTKKKKPRSKFTKFLTSLLSLSSSSDDEEYGREDAGDTGTSSSKSSDW